MIAVTGEYLINIIERRVNQTIGLRRNLSATELLTAPLLYATNEEIADFILSIPYFDERLKNFILGFSTEQTIIISQTWEIAFSVRTGRWAESDEWLHGAFRLSMNSLGDVQPNNPDFLTLPY
ncbi:hypothetical protein QWZ08_22130 [Ferruginibacter paludis]|uniref:hypothetical protein n=1 Tax=Ferruginibacter paludis TaxID=1310417 RepID=UPI0025B30D9B|nr:hypothetical protein [Ferruginibacter paludis]MDN3658369.1 hypothetical protein [Ferruginibacter paludis]